MSSQVKHTHSHQDTIYFVFFILHSLTTRLAVHLGKSESRSLFDTEYFVLFEFY